MLSTSKRFLSVPKNYQLISLRWAWKPSEAGNKKENDEESEYLETGKNPYKDLLEKDPDNYVVDPLEFRNAPEFTGDAKPVRKPARTFVKYLRYRSPRLDLSFKNLGKKFSGFMMRTQRKDQQYNAERVKTLGPDLAAAHFIVFRGGGVKFLGRDGFIQNKRDNTESELPPSRDDRYKVEAINAAGVPLFYEGFLNFSDLKYLKWLSVKDNPYFDSWCMDRLSLVVPHLEYLDISGCKLLDHNSLGCLYRFRQLKCINVKDTNDSKSFKLACLTLESEYPHLVITGITFKKTPKSVFN